MRVLVTGSAGFIGRHLVQRLEGIGHEVSTYDLVDGQGILDRDNVRTSVEGMEAVVHLAAVSSVVQFDKNPIKALKTNVNGAENVAAACEFAGARRLVFASSSAIYHAVPWSQNYGWSKWQAEYPCWRVALLGVNVSILRIFNVTGPGGSGVVNRFQQQAAAGQQLTIHGDGQQTRDFIHVDDVTRAIGMALAAPGNHICDIGTGTPTTIAEVAALYSDDIVHLPARPRDPRHSVADTEPALQQLGFASRIAPF